MSANMALSGIRPGLLRRTGSQAHARAGDRLTGAARTAKGGTGKGDGALVTRADIRLHRMTPGTRGNVGDSSLIRGDTRPSVARHCTLVSWRPVPGRWEPYATNQDLFAVGGSRVSKRMETVTIQYAGAERPQQPPHRRKLISDLQITPSPLNPLCSVLHLPISFLQNFSEFFRTAVLGRYVPNTRTGRLTSPEAHSARADAVKFRTGDYFQALSSRRGGLVARKASVVPWSYKNFIAVMGPRRREEGSYKNFIGRSPRGYKNFIGESR